jgi:hypothetical protein
VNRTPSKWNVVPRYTAGSPAAVDPETAERVAKEERAAYERVLTGAYGEEEKRRAERLGLEGIVYWYIEARRRPQVRVYDVIEAYPRTFTRWEDFARWSQDNREASRS